MRPLPMIPALFIAAALAGAGCYTVLRHPETYDLEDDYGSGKACSDCHADADLYHYTDGRWGGWYELYPAPWAYYYQSPWWYSDYWYPPPPPHPEPGVPVETGRRHMWDRQIEGGSRLPSQGVKAEEPQNPSAPQSPGNTPNRTEEKPQGGKEDEKDKDSGKRRLWGR